MMVENATSETERIATAALEKAVAEKAERRAALETKVNGAIALVQSDPRLPLEEKAKIIAQLSAALGGATLPNVDLILANAERATQAEVSEYYADAVLTEASYPDYASYSNKGRFYIRKQVETAFKESKTLQLLHTNIKALNVDQRTQAEKEVAENWKKFNHLTGDSQYVEYKEELALMRGFGLPSTPHGRSLLEAIANKAPREEINAKIEEAIQFRVKLAEPVIADILPKIEQTSQYYIQGHYSKTDGAIDTRKMVEDWAKIPATEKDAAYQAFNAAHGDINKLSQAQQKIIHLSTVMIASEAALPMQATIAIVERDQALTAKLTDRSIDPEVRATLLIDEMRAQGYVGGNPNLTRKAALDMIETLDSKDVDTLALLRKHDYAAVGNIYQRSLLDDTAIAGNSAQTAFTASTAIGVYADAQTDAAGREIPVWIKNDPERLANYTKEIAEWQKIENDLAKAYTPEALAAASINISAMPAKPLTAQEQQKVDDDLRAINPVKAYYDGLKAAGITPEKPVSTLAVNVAEAGVPLAEVSLANTGVTPPLGIDRDAIAAAKVACEGLCSAGVTGSAEPLVSGVPPEGVAVTGAAMPASAAGSAPAYPR